ncbi:hypothetical protein CEXT_22541 [Caerostris extrusa]|uniref:Uncharacterized protein n=1 Tax=Caerostris extrusa TaxID=172846 RepID=A0AAV4W4M0_CAEEX|nr:hypothetical protein CEXT_22541 [Caerostris extrusa]
MPSNALRYLHHGRHWPSGQAPLAAAEISTVTDKILGQIQNIQIPSSFDVKRGKAQILGSLGGITSKRLIQNNRSNGNQHSNALRYLHHLTCDVIGQAALGNTRPLATVARRRHVVQTPRNALVGNPLILN